MQFRTKIAQQVILSWYLFCCLLWTATFHNPWRCSPTYAVALLEILQVIRNMNVLLACPIYCCTWICVYVVFLEYLCLQACNIIFRSLVFQSLPLEYKFMLAHLCKIYCILELWKNFLFRCFICRMLPT